MDMHPQTVLFLSAQQRCVFLCHCYVSWMYLVCPSTHDILVRNDNRLNYDIMNGRGSEIGSIQ